MCSVFQLHNQVNRQLLVINNLNCFVGNRNYVHIPYMPPFNFKRLSTEKSNGNSQFIFLFFLVRSKNPSNMYDVKCETEMTEDRSRAEKKERKKRIVNLSKFSAFRLLRCSKNKWFIDPLLSTFIPYINSFEFFK